MERKPRQIQDRAQVFYYLIVHRGMFSLKKSGGAPKSSIPCLEAILLVMLKYKTEL